VRCLIDFGLTAANAAPAHQNNLWHPARRARPKSTGRTHAKSTARSTFWSPLPTCAGRKRAFPRQLTNVLCRKEETLSRTSRMGALPSFRQPVRANLKTVDAGHLACRASGVSGPNAQRYHLGRSRLDPIQRIRQPLQRRRHLRPVAAPVVTDADCEIRVFFKQLLGLAQSGRGVRRSARNGAPFRLNIVPGSA
jgi:hypothetical protein